MFFDIGLYTSLSVCGFGILYRMYAWFNRAFDLETDPTAGRRILPAGGSVKALFSRHWTTILTATVADILVQRTIYKSNRWQWLAHMLVVYGFVMLLLMHAMDGVVTASLFPEYESTLNPYMFLRNLFGVMVAAGVVVFMVRRSRRHRELGLTSNSDRLAIFLLALILGSGFALESTLIISEAAFDSMVEDYLGSDDPEEIDALRQIWHREYGVVFASPLDDPTPERLEAGSDLNAESCVACHSRPQAAFVSFSLARAYGDAAILMNKKRLDRWLWYVHVLACFCGIAYLPFSKFFHLVSVPVNLLVRSIHRSETAAVQGGTTAAVRLGLDACTHCGVCSLGCRVAPIYRLLGNPTILPSEKLGAVRSLASRRHLPDETLARLSEGSFICTDCYRCTTVCPSAIPLHDLWQASKRHLKARGFPPPHEWIREKTAYEWTEGVRKAKQGSRLEKKTAGMPRQMDRAEAFSACVQCSICSGVCPVVEARDIVTPKDMTPQQVMNLLRLGLKDLAMGSRMVWDCVTCYQCQEHCPQHIRIVDIFYELRNRACRRLPAARFGKAE